MKASLTVRKHNWRVHTKENAMSGDKMYRIIFTEPKILTIQWKTFIIKKEHLCLWCIVLDISRYALSLQLNCSEILLSRSLFAQDSIKYEMFFVPNLVINTSEGDIKVILLHISWLWLVEPWMCYIIFDNVLEHFGPLMWADHVQHMCAPDKCRTWIQIYREVSM